MPLLQAPESLLKFEYEVETKPRWLTLNIELGNARLEAGAILGIVANLSGGAGSELNMFVRTTRDDEFVDTQFDEGLLGSDVPSVRVAMHQLAQDSGSVGATGFHTLIIELPFKKFDLDLREVQIFVLPAAHGLHLSDETLGRFS